MDTTISPLLLKMLGAAPAALGPPEVLSPHVAASDQAWASGSRSTGLLRPRWEVLQDASWEPVECRVASQLGMEVQRGISDLSVGWWSIWSGLGERLKCALSDAGAGEVVEASAEPALVYLRLHAEASGAALIEGGGAFLFVEPEAARLRVSVGFRHLVQLAPLPALRVDVEALLEGVEDGWLREAVACGVALEDAWSQAAAVGMARRLRAEPRARQRARVQLALEGEEDPVDARVLAWARQLEPGALAQLHRLCCVEVVCLQEELLQLREALEGEESLEASSCGVWLDALGRRRDDLQSVLCVLRWARHRAPLPEGLEALDASGELLSESLRDVERDEEEQLTRAGRFEPTGWWGTI